MDKREIHKRLRVLKGTDNKIKYLKNTLKKKGVLKLETRNAIYEFLGENYKSLAQEKGEAPYLINSAEYFERAGLKDEALMGWRNVVQFYMEVDIPNSDIVLRAVESLRKSGRKREARAIGRKLGKKTEIYGVTEKSPYALKQAHKIYEATGQSKEAERVERELKGLSEKKARAPEKKGLLERMLQKASLVIVFAISIFFLSSNITGNVIGNLTNSTSNLIGIVLLVSGLIGGYFYLKRR